ncbi:MAG: ion transporter [Spirulina sp. SIO3F2]|nr:ion transporter [Spirulina sp. SIO3F2]
MTVLNTVQTQCDRVVKSPRFEQFIIWVLIIDFFVLCLEGGLPHAQLAIKTVLDLILGILIVDTLLRFGATISRVGHYFGDFWNCFDLLILVGLIYLPDEFSYLALLRLPRFWRSSRILRGIGFVKFLLLIVKRISLWVYVDRNRSR